MPSPLANRFIHLEVEANYESFKNMQIKIFQRKLLHFRPKITSFNEGRSKSMASPRSWEMASKLFNSGIPIDIAVGEGAASE